MTSTVRSSRLWTLLFWAMLLCFVVEPCMGWAVFAQEAGDVPGWAADIDKGIDGAKTAADDTHAFAEPAGSLPSNAKFDKAVANLPSGDDATLLSKFNGFVKNKKELLEKIAHYADRLSKALEVVDIIKSFMNGDYKEGIRDALKFVASFLIDRGVNILVEAAVGFVCAFVSGPFFAVCYIALSAGANYLIGRLVDKAFEKLADWGFKEYCQIRPGYSRCPPAGVDLAHAGAPPSAGAPPDIGAPSGIGAPASAGGPGGGGRSGTGGRGGGARVGSTSIQVNAGAIRTNASNGGAATTEIGSISSGSGSTRVSAGDIITEGNGRSASTDIAPNGGTVVTMGPVVNEGGNLTMGGDGTVSRNGQLCVDIYMNTCMVQVYPKPAHHPCAPGFVWKPTTNMCERPSDHEHSITEPQF